MQSDSHNTYCVTSDTYHNIWCLVTDAVALVVLVGGAYAAFVVAAILDASVGVQ
jgi:hypothetical protein